MSIPNFDSRLEPTDDLDAKDDREMIRCYWCEEWLEDGTGERIAWMYGHPPCRRKYDDMLAHGLMAELSADERRDDK